MGFGWWSWDVVFEALVTGAWLTLVPSLLLVLIATAIALDAQTLRRAWFGCLLSGFVGMVLGFAGGLPAGLGIDWTIPGRFEPGWMAWGCVAVYCSGVIWILGRAALGWLALRRWTAASQPVHEKRVIDAFEVAKAALGVRTPCYLLAGHDVPSPFSAGWLNHRVLLPSALLEELDDEELRDLAIHEMAHVRRRDPGVFALAVLVKALLWPNPFVWLAMHQLKLNAEKVADHAVVSVTDEVKPYSRLLLKMSEHTARGTMVPLAAGVYLHKSFFIQRAEALVAGTLTGSHPTGSPAMVWATLVFGACGALAFAPGWPVAEAGENRSVGSGTEAGTVLETLERPVEALLRDGLFPEDAWVRFEANRAAAEPVVPVLEAHWLDALGLAEVPRFFAYRHLYEDDGGKQSIFAFERKRGGLILFSLDRGKGAGTGSWRIGRESSRLESLKTVRPGSETEQAIIHLLRAWPLAALGSEDEWRQLLRHWPEVEPGSIEDAALMMGESLETFRELRLYGEDV